MHNKNVWQEFGLMENKGRKQYLETIGEISTNRDAKKACAHVWGTPQMWL